MELRQELEACGSIFQTTIDSEVFVHLIAKFLNGNSLEEAVIKACNKVKGAYSILLLANDKIIAVRDPHGDASSRAADYPSGPASRMAGRRSRRLGHHGARLGTDPPGRTAKCHGLDFNFTSSYCYGPAITVRHHFSAT